VLGGVAIMAAALVAAVLVGTFRFVWS